jgi:hypothetical protein
MAVLDPLNDFVRGVSATQRSAFVAVRELDATRVGRTVTTHD